MSNILDYKSNNSGGSWWLDDAAWKALDATVWNVDWLSDRWLGALAKSASVDLDQHGLTRDQAIAIWADATKALPDARGCDCCGRPHMFY